MIEAIRMGVKAIMTDKPAALMGLYKECEADWNKVSSEVGWTFGWFTPRYYSVVNVCRRFLFFSMVLRELRVRLRLN